MILRRLAWLLAAGALSACAFGGPQDKADMPPTEDVPPTAEEQARVLSVDVSGGEGAFTFAVQIASPDTGCDRYADWWEVVTPDGQLLYRRILLHSHVDEQPFTRSGGPILVGADDEVIVRAHMNPGGYGSQVAQGSPSAGFRQAVLRPGFAAELEGAPPQPDGCAF